MGLDSIDQRKKGTEGLLISQSIFPAFLTRAPTSYLSKLYSIVQFNLFSKSVIPYRLTIMCCLTNKAKIFFT